MRNFDQFVRIRWPKSVKSDIYRDREIVVISGEHLEGNQDEWSSPLGLSAFTTLASEI